MTKLPDNIDIKLFELWMKPQVAKLFQDEYKISDTEFEKFMSRLYEHPFQKDKCIQIVAIEGEKVIGFQSFFYWPYSFEGKKFHSYQSGNSLVHPDYRGKRLFARMLDFIHQNPVGNEIDFLMGFPVQASYNSFLKNGWINLFDLKWSVNLMNPIGFLFSKRNLNKYFIKPGQAIINQNPELIGLSEENLYRVWKTQLVYEPENYYEFVFNNTNNKVVFDLKIQTRKKIINELIIGNIRFENCSSDSIEKAIKALIKATRKSMCVSLLSVALNDQYDNPNLSGIFSKLGFKRIENKIYFIIKPIKVKDTVLNPKLWNIGRADIDTW